MKLFAKASLQVSGKRDSNRTEKYHKLITNSITNRDGHLAGKSLYLRRMNENNKGSILISRVDFSTTLKSDPVNYRFLLVKQSSKPKNSIFTF